MEAQQPCLYCGSTRGTVFVHGHYQCVQCGQNVMPCCDGAPSEQGHFGNQTSQVKSDQTQNHESWNQSS